MENAGAESVTKRDSVSPERPSGSSQTMMVKLARSRGQRGMRANPASISAGVA